MATKKQNNFGILEGTLVYAKIAQADKKYQSEEREWSIEVIVDEETADAWDEQFKKQPSHKIKVSDFEGKYKIPCPIDGVKNVYGIKLKRQATHDGEDVDQKMRPKVFLDTEDERVDITESRLIANGSFGKVSYYISVNDFGTFARLNNVLLDEKGFKEYTSSAGVRGSEFGDARPVKVEPAKESATKARAEKPVKKVKEAEPEDDDSDSAPF